LEYYDQALALQEAMGDRAGLATTLNNIGKVYHSIGDRQKALEYCHKALVLQEAVGDRSGESGTRYNIALIYRSQGKLAAAVEELRKVVELDACVQSPNLAADKALLRQVEEEQHAGLK
jgi:tetratricopeptide (TPR) repeat protein